MTSALTRLSGSAFELTLTIPWPDVKKIYDQVFSELSEEIEIEGFRKGKAPKELLEAKIDKGKVLGEVVNRLLPASYTQALKEHGLKPVISPQVQIVESSQEKDWQFIARACEKPVVDLDHYQEEIKALNAKGKIWTPQTPASQAQDDPKKAEEEKAKKIEAILDKLRQICKVELAELLLESEVSRLLTQLLEDVRGAGLTFEQYLQSSSQTSQSLREKYRQQAERALNLEFILEAVADDLKVEVSQEEIDAIINKETDQAKKDALKNQSYLLASILRRENTITKLLTL